MQNRHRQQLSADAVLAQSQEEYKAAQRLAVESILVGRATAEAVEQQGEQLQRAEALADDTQYKLDKAARLLKGMTWTGWASNLFAANIKPPENSSVSSSRLGVTDNGTGMAASNVLSLEQYDSFPESCRGATQAIRNYNANIAVLKQCETEMEKETCTQICDSMYTAAIIQLEDLSTVSSIKAYVLQLQADLQLLRKRQTTNQEEIRMDQILATAESLSFFKSNDKQMDELFGRQSASSQLQTQQSQQDTSPKKSEITQQEQMQTEHLEVISACLGELGQIAHSLNRGLDQQRETIEALDTKSDNVLETSKMVGRRTERLIQTKSWTTTTSILCGTVSIRHLESGKYLAVLGGGDLYLVNKLNPATGTFSLYKRPQQSGHSKLVGLQSHNNRKWIGQSFLTGTLSCSANQFSRREEWEMDYSCPDAAAVAATGGGAPTSSPFAESTRLLCASAGWGQGGYMQVRVSDFAILIGGPSVAESKSAAQWMILPQRI